MFFLAIGKTCRSCQEQDRIGLTVSIKDSYNQNLNGYADTMTNR